MQGFEDVPKDSTGRSYRSWPAEAFSGRIFVGYCFSQELPDTDVFPDGATGATFVNCNLDNCLIPGGSTVSGGSQRRFRAQQDGLDWLLDDDDQPVSRLL